MADHAKGTSTTTGRSVPLGESRGVEWAWPRTGSARHGADRPCARAGHARYPLRAVREGSRVPQRQGPRNAFGQGPWPVEQDEPIWGGT